MKRFLAFFDAHQNALPLQNLAAAVLLLSFFAHSFYSVRQIATTSDEPLHYKYGQRLLKGNAARIKESVMPVSAWNALPEALAELLPQGKLQRFLGSQLVARLMTTLFACAVGWLVFSFARRLYGFFPALLSLGLYVFDPNILAHAQLITTDLYATGALLLVVFCAWRLTVSRSWGNRVLFAASLGLAQVTKFTAISFVPVIFLTLLIHDVIQLRQQGRGDRPRAWAGLLREYLLLLGLVSLAVVLVLNAAYLGQRTLTPFGEYSFRYDFFSGLQQKFPALNQLLVPVPYAHLQGLDWIFEFERIGAGHGNHYLLGQARTGKGFWGYFFVAFLLKEPLATQILLLAALWVYFSDPKRRALLWRQELFLLLPVLFYTIYFNFFYNSQVGLRYYLIVFPLLQVFAGSLFVNWRRFSTRQAAALAGLLAYLVVSVFSYYPYYLPYFNELVWDRRFAYRYLADSNLDWDQGQLALIRYLQANPQADFDPGTITAGKIVVAPNALVGVTTDPQQYAWLRDNFSPKEVIAFEYLVYDISTQEVKDYCARVHTCP